MKYLFNFNGKTYSIQDGDTPQRQDSKVTQHNLQVERVQKKEWSKKPDNFLAYMSMDENTVELWTGHTLGWTISSFGKIQGNNGAQYKYSYVDGVSRIVQLVRCEKPDVGAQPETNEEAA